MIQATGPHETAKEKIRKLVKIIIKAWVNLKKKK
jgi:hypothetical protein